MAGGLTISTLNNDTGVLATQNGMTGIAKAWVNFNGTVNPATIRDSFNVSSITVNGTGDYTVNFSTAMPNANFVVAGNAFNDQAGGTYVGLNDGRRTTTTVRVSTKGVTETYFNCPIVNVSVFSS